MPPVMSPSQILSHDAAHAAVAGLREMWGGTPNNGTAATNPIGDVVGLPVLYVCGSKDAAILCNRSYALKTKEYVKNGTYENVVVECGHDLLACDDEKETAKVVQSIVAHLKRSGVR